MELTAPPPALASTELTQAEIDGFNERGFHIHGKLFSDEEVEALRIACENVCRGHLR